MVFTPLSRRVLAGFVGLHGAAHLAGTTDLFSRAADGRAADLFTGETADPLVLRVLAIAFAVTAALYVLVALAIWTGRSGWPRRLGTVTLASLVLTIIALWASVIGLAIDVLLLLLVLVVAVTQARRRTRVAR